MSLSLRISHLESLWPVVLRSVYYEIYHISIKRDRFERKQEEQDSATDYVLATSGYLHLKLCQNRANPIYRCKIFAKAHPRAKVSQTNTHRLKAARKITEWAGCLLLLVHWQFIRSKTEPSPAFFRCRIFLWCRIFLFQVQVTPMVVYLSKSSTTNNAPQWGHFTAYPIISSDVLIETWLYKTQAAWKASL